MKERNPYSESGGLFFKSETHEWFHDKGLTSYAQKEDIHGVKSKDLTVYVVRDLQTGEYDRVVLDNKIKQVVYSNKNLEEVACFIDRLKISKQFDKENDNKEMKTVSSKKRKYTR